LLETGQQPLAELLSRMRPSFGRRLNLIVITPNSDGLWIKEMMPLLWAGSVPTVLLLDPSTYGGPASQSANQRLLAGLGVKHYLISRDLLQRPESQPGRRGRWEWRVSPSGRAIAVSQPEDQSWKSIA
jgi:hypothetical protein